ncbi:hypothetical protein Mapa_003387 [Marchantia paleacea]|nr:hypothetical protein Mapa_003387 [Marchantia paleacea]
MVSGSTKLGSLCLYARCRENELELAHPQSLRRSSKETGLIRLDSARSASVESICRVHLHRKRRRRWFTRTRPVAWVMWEASSAATTVRMACLVNFLLSPVDEEVLASVPCLEKECLDSGIIRTLAVKLSSRSVSLSMSMLKVACCERWHRGGKEGCS